VKTSAVKSVETPGKSSEIQSQPSALQTPRATARVNEAVTGEEDIEEVILIETDAKADVVEELPVTKPKKNNFFSEVEVDESAGV